MIKLFHEIIYLYQRYVDWLGFNYTHICIFLPLGIQWFIEIAGVSCEHNFH